MTWTQERNDTARRRCEEPLTWSAESILFLAAARQDFSDALDEIERLRALTTISDDMVEQARDAFAHEGETQARMGLRHEKGEWLFVSGTEADADECFRAALEAALNPKEDQP